MNNVWLIFALVVLWTAFPRAFASIMSTLFVPMALAAAGIVLRGCAFVFRKTIQALTGRRFFGATFALSSLLTPFFLGAAFGAVASGRVQAGVPGGDPLSAWIGPTPLLIGALAVLCAAFLAAVFLVFDARRAGDEALERYFRRRAIGSAVATGLLAIAGLFVLERDAPFVFERPRARGATRSSSSRRPVASGVLTLVASGITRGARALAIGAVVAMLAGWGIAQYPYLLPTSLTIAAGAGAPATLRWVLIVSASAVVTLVPALALPVHSRRARPLARKTQTTPPQCSSRTRAIHPTFVRTGGATPQSLTTPSRSPVRDRDPRRVALWMSLRRDTQTSQSVLRRRQRDRPTLRPVTGLASSEAAARYHLVAPIGRGGMAEVLLALMDAGGGFSKVVVLKRIWPDLATDPDFVTMFHDEARLAIRLNHPNVVQTHEVIEEGTNLAIAMEYLHGQPLTTVLNRVADRASSASRCACASSSTPWPGLHYAHELTDYAGNPLGVVHRDVSPHNVFVTYDGQVKLMDFGVAKTAAAAHRTRPGALKGKLVYMAPEHLRSEPVDRRADMFAVGVMLWELLAERRLWHGMAEAHIVHHLAAGVAMPALPPDICRPPVLDAICAPRAGRQPERTLRDGRRAGGRPSGRAGRRGRFARAHARAPGLPCLRGRARRA